MVKAEESVLRDIIAGEKQFQVPLYQRPYQWTVTQWQTLWEDIATLSQEREANNNGPTHFIGSFVIVPLIDGMRRASKFLVVDGQQRLTTLTLLLAAIRDYREEQVPGSGDRVHTSFLTNPHLPQDFYKLVPTQMDRRAYSEVIDRTISGTLPGRPIEAYRFFYDKLLDYFDGPDGDAEPLEDTVLSGLSAVTIQTGPDDNVHRIFQSLNNTGLRLTQGDLIRNLIFMALPNRGEQLYTDCWLPIQEAIVDNEQIENLFWYDMLRTRSGIKAGDIFSTYQKRLMAMTSEDEIEDEVRRISDAAVFYGRILYPDREPHPMIRTRLERLDTWPSSAHNPLVLEILQRGARGEDTPEETAQSLFILESYLVRSFLTGRRVNGSMFTELTSQLDAGEKTHIQLSMLLSTGTRGFATDDELRTSLRTYPYYVKGNARTRKLVLEWLEQTYASKEPVNTRKLSIEHIMPQTLSTPWTKELMRKYGASYTTEFEVLKHTLGNLTLTGYNSELSNTLYADKRAAYADSALRMTKEVATYETWGFEEIRLRADRLAERIITTWWGPMGADDMRDVVAPRWRKVHQVIENIPAGRWASYNDIAEATGVLAQKISTYLSQRAVDGSHRVLRNDGSVDESNLRLGAGATLSIRQVLEAEGATFTRGRADGLSRLAGAEVAVLAAGERLDVPTA